MVRFHTQLAPGIAAHNFHSSRELVNGISERFFAAFPMQDTPSKSRLSNGSHCGTTSGQPGQQSWLERNLVPVSKKTR